MPDIDELAPDKSSDLTTTTVNRHLDCEGVFNLRDLGGYMTPDGRRLRWRTLYRADGLHRAVPGDPTIVGCRWRTVIDLRTVAERDAGGYESEDACVLHLPMLRDVWDAEAARAEIGNVAWFLTERYLEMAESGAAAIATAFDVVASPARLPAVFHCSAGKDRTGVLAALILAALGVDDDQIAADYHLSSRAMDRLVDWITATRPEIAEHMARQPGAFLSCPPDAIVGLLRSLRRQHGSVDCYLADVGVPAATLDALRDALLEDQ